MFVCVCERVCWMLNWMLVIQFPVELRVTLMIDPLAIPERDMEMSK